jgi:hypothetical protein
MSRSTYAPKESYVGTGSLSAYTFDFKIEALTQLLVVELDDSDVETQRVLGDDVTYLSSVTFDSVEGGGTVNLTANLPSNYTLILLLANDNPTQAHRFRDKGSFTLKRIESALDFLAGAIQRLAYRGKQAFRIHDADNEETFDAQFPPGVTSANGKYLKVNDAGDGLEYGTTEAGLAAVVLPSGGITGAVLDKASAADGDVQWNPHAYDSYSNRFSEPFISTNLADTISKILDFTYVAPLVSLAAAGSTTVREKGNPVASVDLTASVTKTTDPIARIQFKKDAVNIDDNNPPGDTGTHDELHTYSVAPFSDNVTFSVEVTDDGASGGPSTVTDSKSFVFVYPYYFGAGAVGLTPAQVAALTKDIIVSTVSVNESFTTTDGQVYYFAYPASYGVLTSILDENGFETFSDWTLTVDNITGLDATPISYNIYEFNNPVIAGSTNYTFVR